MPIERDSTSFPQPLGVAGVAGVGGIAGAGLGGGARSFAAEPPPEITTIRLEKAPPTTCLAPQFVAEDLLRAEGFTDIRYRALGRGHAHELTHNRWIGTFVVAPNLIATWTTALPSQWLPVCMLGCFELFAHDDIRSITELRGRAVGWFPGYATPRHLVASWQNSLVLILTRTSTGSDDPRPSEGTFYRSEDRCLPGPAPEAQELRARKIGHSLVNSATDRPWSQYYCCMLVGRTEFVQKYPIATKRIVRAILKATDLCASEPERVARLMVERGFTPRYDYALQTLQSCPTEFGGITIPRIPCASSRCG